MLYIIAGVPRSGKSILSRRFHLVKNIPYFSTDFLMMGLYEGLPQLGVSPKIPAGENAPLMWPILKGTLKSIVESQDEDYLIEGEAFLPAQMSELVKMFPSKIKVCFIGYTDISPEQKLKDIRENKSLANDWSSQESDEYIMDFVTRMNKLSKFIKEECDKYQLTYYDTSKEFNNKLNNAYEYLAKK